MTRRSAKDPAAKDELAKEVDVLFADKASDPRMCKTAGGRKEYKPYPELRPIGRDWLKWGCPRLWDDEARMGTAVIVRL